MCVSVCLIIYNIALHVVPGNPSSEQQAHLPSRAEPHPSLAFACSRHVVVMVGLPRRRQSRC